MMMKTADEKRDMQSSSSQRETKHGNRRQATKKSVGCMSGLLHLLTRHHHGRSRKRLPSAQKKEHKPPIFSPLPPPPPQESRLQRAAASPRSPTLVQKKEKKPTIFSPLPPPPETRLQRAAASPRSPTLAPELRRPCPPPSPDSPRRASALVARLMGLDEAPAVSPDSTAEKRRKLMGALEKCDEDLQALKRIIEAMQTPQPKWAPDVKTSPKQPSPVSVLDALASPVRQPVVKHPGRSFYRRVAVEGLPRAAAVDREGRRRWSWQRSRAMVESVGEVWDDGLWEERWEVGKVGLVLEGEIFGDLVDEVVMEMVGCFYMLWFSIGNCRKRLCF